MLGAQKKPFEISTLFSSKIRKRKSEAIVIYEKHFITETTMIKTSENLKCNSKGKTVYMSLNC